MAPFTLPGTGPISMSQVNVELGKGSTSRISLGDSAVRNLAGRPSGSISMGHLRGKSQGFKVSSDTCHLAISYADDTKQWKAGFTFGSMDPGAIKETWTEKPGMVKDSAGGTATQDIVYHSFYEIFACGAWVQNSLMVGVKPGVTYTYHANGSKCYFELKQKGSSTGLYYYLFWDAVPADGNSIAGFWTAQAINNGSYLPSDNGPLVSGAPNKSYGNAMNDIMKEWIYGRTDTPSSGAVTVNKPTEATLLEYKPGLPVGIIKYLGGGNFVRIIGGIEQNEIEFNSDFMELKGY